MGPKFALKCFSELGHAYLGCSYAPRPESSALYLIACGNFWSYFRSNINVLKICYKLRPSEDLSSWKKKHAVSSFPASLFSLFFASLCTFVTEVPTRAKPAVGAFCAAFQAWHDMGIIRSLMKCLKPPFRKAPLLGWIKQNINHRLNALLNRGPI